MRPIAESTGIVRGKSWRICAGCETTSEGAVCAPSPKPVSGGYAIQESVIEESREAIPILVRDVAMQCKTRGG